MKASFLVPYKGGEPHRDANWSWVSRRLAHLFPEWEVCIGSNGDNEVFCRGVALNDAASKATGDVFVIQDADTFVNPGQLVEAVELAASAPGPVVAGVRWLALPPYLTRKVRQFPLDYQILSEPKHEDSVVTVSGCVAISRESWNAVNGFPPEFRGWGFEDNAFWYACETLVAQGRRVAGDIYHLWHPTSRDPGSPTFHANAARCDEYGAAYGDADKMRALIASR